MQGGQTLLPSLQELTLVPSFPQEVPLVLSLNQEEVELPLLLELSVAEKLPLPPSPSLLQVAGERLKSRPLRKSILPVPTLTLSCLSGSHRFLNSVIISVPATVIPQSLS